MNLRKVIVEQFGNPHGFLGRIAGWIMANRRSNRERNLWTVDLLSIQPGDRIVEIGCGPGVALEACLAKVREGKVIGLDHSQTMLDQAQSRNAKAIREGRLGLRLGTLADLAATIGSFDKAYSVNVVQFFPDRTAVFHQIYSLLKPKGVSATTYMPRSKNPSRTDALNMAAEVKQHMEVAGFANIRVEELPLDPVPAVCVIGERP
jgi:ubiquinone/menaquinone biosynthesis C-methylase UbiE